MLGFVVTATSDSEEVDDTAALLKRSLGIILSHHQELVLVSFFMSNLSFTSGISPTYSLVYELHSEICEIFTT